MYTTVSPLHFVMAIIFGIASAYLANKNKKNPYLWFALGFFFGILGLFFLFFLPKLQTSHALNRKNLDRSPVFQGPVDKLWFYLDPSHNQVGPISFNAVKKALDNGEISANSYVWHEDLKDWKHLKEFIVK